MSIGDIIYKSSQSICQIMLQIWIKLFLIFVSSHILHVQCRSPNRPYSVHVKCSKKSMDVMVNIANDAANFSIYLEKLKDYPYCQPKHVNGTAFFSLPLDNNFYYCGTTKVRDKLTNSKLYYNKIVIENLTNQSKHVFVSKCVLNLHSHRPKRQLENEDDLPENFTESVDELIDFSGNYTERAPIPYLNIAVRQNGQFVDTALNVHPGTPLEMIIYLDDTSAPIYGLLASFLKVTDNTPRKQEEVIISKGCSIDPYIFSNFEASEGGDSIRAKFRAFKFPESNYVLFVGTVNVCLKECLGVQCGNGLLGFGRKRRSIPNKLPPDPNKVFEIEMTAFLKVDSLPYHHKKSSMLAGTINSKYMEDYSTNHEPIKVKSSKYEVTSLPTHDRLQSDKVHLKLSKNGQASSHTIDGLLIFLFLLSYCIL